MKRVGISVGILQLIAASCAASAIWFSSLSDSYRSMISQIELDGTAGDRTRTAQRTKYMLEQWEQQQPILAYLLDRDALREADLALRLLDQAVQTKDTAAIQAHCIKAREIMTELFHGELPLPSNVL